MKRTLMWIMSRLWPYKPHPLGWINVGITMRNTDNTVRKS